MISAFFAAVSHPAGGMIETSPRDVPFDAQLVVEAAELVELLIRWAKRGLQANHDHTVCGVSSASKTHVMRQSQYSLASCHEDTRPKPAFQV